MLQAGRAWSALRGTARALEGALVVHQPCWASLACQSGSKRAAVAQALQTCGRNMTEFICSKASHVQEAAQLSVWMTAAVSNLQDHLEHSADLVTVVL